MYCSLEDLTGRMSEDKILELVDFESTGDINGTEAQKRLNDALSDADAEINSYCQRRYQVPFEPVPDFIKKLAIDITLYNLFSLRGFDEDSPDKVIADRYKGAVKTLENLAKGIVTIGQPETLPTDTVNRPSITGPDRVFSREKMSGY